MDFVTTLKELDITIDGKLYKLREATEGVMIEYRRTLSAGAKVDGDGKAQSIPEGFAASESVLVQGCLFDGAQRVPLQVVRGWPRRVVKELYNMAEEISGLNGDRVKNSPPATQEPSA